MRTVLLILYVVNAVFLINHEIESAYWKEWNLFGLKGGITGYVLFHFPLLFLVLYGIVWIRDGKLFGLVMSALLSAAGIFAFIVHSYFLRKGRKEFRFLISRVLLFGTFVLSLPQLGLTAYLFSRWMGR